MKLLQIQACSFYKEAYMLTIKQIRAKCSWYQPYRATVRPGCFRLPSVKLRCITDSLLPNIANGEIVTVESIDETGPKPDSVHFEEKAGWWLAKHFELTSDQVFS